MGKNERHQEADLGRGKKVAGRQAPGFLSPTSPTAQRALILLCEKCGRKLGSGGDNVARRLQKSIKHGASERFGKRQVRAVLGSCLDICPKGKIAACLIPVALVDGEARAPSFVELEADDLVGTQAAILDLL